MPIGGYTYYSKYACMHPHTILAVPGKEGARED